MKVWVVFREYQAATPEILGVYAHEETAKQARKVAVLDDVENGRTVEPDPDEEDEEGDGYDDCDWDVDINVEEIELDESLPAPVVIKPAVYVVKGERLESSGDGELSWIVGTAATLGLARKLAEGDAAEIVANTEAKQTVYIQGCADDPGTLYVPGRGYDPERSSREAPDWTLWYEITLQEVRS